MTQQMTIRLSVAVALLVSCLQVAAAQERAPNGEIYRELLPFVGLEGIRLQITGLQGGIFNVPGDVIDPEKTVTGLTHAEREELAKAVYADVDDVLRASGVPVLARATSAREVEVRPLLAIDIHWARVKPDVITVQVTIELMEAARPVKDPSRIVWTSSWRSTYNSIASGPDTLPAIVRSVTRGQVESFGRLYERAHAK